MRVEVRRIDTNEDIGLGGNQVSDQFFAPRQQLAQAAQDFHQPHDGQTFHREIRGQAFSLHQRTANTYEFDGRVTSLERTHESRAQNVTGSLTRYQRNTQIGHD
ncbi:hypothetical protein ABIA48_001749 [Pseudomonas sp. S30_BP2TU TE3576]